VGRAPAPLSSTKKRAMLRGSGSATPPRERDDETAPLTNGAAR